MTKKKKQPADISRGIRLKADVWAALERLRKQHGSYNKALRYQLGVDSNGKTVRELSGSKTDSARRKQGAK